MVPTSAGLPVTVGTGAGAYGTIDESYSGSGPKVAILGDSILASSRRQITAALDGYSVRMGAIVGEGLSGGQISHAVGGGAMPEVARDYAGSHPAIAVIALGTNDAWTPQLTGAAAVDALEGMDRDFGPACLVTVTIAESANVEGYAGGEAAEINEALRGTGDHVVDWSKIAAEHRDQYLKADGLHPTSEGSAALASRIAEAVHACDGGASSRN